MAFTTHADAHFDVCFENALVAQHAVISPSRHIELDIDIGADARDWSAIQAAEKLKPAEMELRRIEELVQEVVGEMDYLRTREQKLRDTNESTNERVKWFAFGTMGMLVGLGGWQVVYLRAYFRYVGHLPLQKLLTLNWTFCAACADGSAADRSISSRVAASGLLPRSWRRKKYVLPSNTRCTKKASPVLSCMDTLEHFRYIQRGMRERVHLRPNPEHPRGQNCGNLLHVRSQWRLAASHLVL